MANLTSDVVLLKKIDYGDSDLIVTLLTREGGKVSALARAAKRSRRRFGGALVSFTVSHAELTRRPRRELHTLSSATPRESFAGIATDMVALAHASYGTELVRELVAAEVVETRIFDLLVSLYRVLLQKGPNPRVLRVFELQLLRHLGLEPDFTQCMSCGSSSDERLSSGAIFDPGSGGVVCRECAPEARGLGVRQLEDPARRLLVSSAQIPSLEDAAVLTADDDGARDARNLMLGLVQAQVGAPLKSIEFATQLASGRQ